MPAAGVAIADLQGFIADSCDTCEARKAFSFKLVYQGYLYKEATDTKKTIELITEAKVYNVGLTHTLRFLALLAVLAVR